MAGLSKQDSGIHEPVSTNQQPEVMRKGCVFAKGSQTATPEPSCVLTLLLKLNTVSVITQLEASITATEWCAHQVSFAPRLQREGLQGEADDAAIMVSCEAKLASCIVNPPIIRRRKATNLNRPVPPTSLGNRTAGRSAKK